MSSQDRPHCRPVWRDRDACAPQPTCYAPRNPCAPWIAAELPDEQEQDDIEAARVWVNTPGPRVPAPYEVTQGHGGG